MLESALHPTSGAGRIISKSFWQRDMLLHRPIDPSVDQFTERRTLPTNSVNARAVDLLEHIPEPQTQLRRPEVSLRCCPVLDIAPPVASQTNVGLLGVTNETFEHAEPRAGLADLDTRLIAHDLLVRTRLEELADP